MGEVVWQARASLVGDHFLYSCVACHPQVVKRLMGWSNREKKWVIAFDEGEHILMVSFFTEITLKGFYGPVPRALIVVPCDFRHWAPFWTSWLPGYVAQIASISCPNVFLAALSCRHWVFFLRNQYIKKTFTRDWTHFTNLWLLLVMRLFITLFYWHIAHTCNWIFGKI